MSDVSKLKIGAIFDSDRNIMREIHRKVQKNKELMLILAKHLDASLLEHCVVAGYEQGILRLLVDNASWATVLRYTAPTLQEELRKEEVFRDLLEVQPKVAEPQPLSKITSPITPKRLSEEASSILQTTAETVQNSKLKQALNRLGRLKK